MLWSANARYGFIWWIRAEAVRLSLSFRDALLTIVSNPAQSVHRSRVMISHSDGQGSTSYALPSGKTTSDVLELCGYLLRQYDRVYRQLILAGTAEPQQDAVLDELLALTDEPVREFTNDFSLLGYQR